MGAFLGSSMSYYETTGLDPEILTMAKLTQQTQGCCSNRGEMRTWSITISLLSMACLGGGGGTLKPHCRHHRCHSQDHLPETQQAGGNVNSILMGYASQLMEM